MATPEQLSELEQLVMLALVRLGDDAYGVGIRREITECVGRRPSTAAVYAALDRLERSGFVSSWLSAPTPERGGRARKNFRIEEAGAQALHDARRVIARMWKGLDVHPDLTS